MRSKQWAADIKKRYGLSEQEYEGLLRSQGGRCPGCMTVLYELPSKFVHIDHDHRTGLVRGILCAQCNNALGMVRENEDILLRLVGYLREKAR